MRQSMPESSSSSVINRPRQMNDRPLRMLSRVCGCSNEKRIQTKSRAWTMPARLDSSREIDQAQTASDRLAIAGALRRVGNSVFAFQKAAGDDSSTANIALQLTLPRPELQPSSSEKKMRRVQPPRAEASPNSNSERFATLICPWTSA